MSDTEAKSIRGYQLHERIGSGGFGAVYKAFQPAVKRDVAIKVILPDYANQPNFIRRFESEAQMVARLEHPFIVPLYDYWREPDGAYLVMRWLRGGSLRGLINKGPIEPAATARLLDQIASALTAAHRHGIIHRDLKPDNILLDEEHSAYLADFGIALDLNIGPELEDEGVIVGSPPYLSPEQIKSIPLTPQSDIYSLGIVLYEMLTGNAPFVNTPASSILLKHLTEPTPHLREFTPHLPDSLNDLIQKATAKDPSMRYSDALALAADFHRALEPHQVDAEPTVVVPIADALFQPENPYKGLRAFQEADAADFFGRESLVERLLRRMDNTSAPDDTSLQNARFLAVVGPSGSGKSSVVKAGLIPALRQGALPGSERWFTLEIVPGTHPLEELEAALLRIAVNPPASLLDQLRDDERGLARAVKRVLPGQDDQLFLVIDQFEELFTLVHDDSERAQFLKILLSAAVDPRSQIRMVATLRADFYDRPLMYPEFGLLMRERTELVLPLSRDELEQVITGPAQRVGLKLEAGLAATIIAEIEDQPAALPLLQYALSELYERRAGRMLTLAAYHESGKVLGALARRADELYHELEPRGQQAVRQLFLRLVAPGEGTEDTRRRVQQSEILSTQDGDITQTIIERYGKYRLLTFDRDPVTRSPTVEVAHEALLRQWGLLRQWIEESREDLRLQRRLSAAADEWFNAGQEPSFLLGGTRLEQFESWLNETDLSLNQREADFLRASREQREKQRAEEAARQAHEWLLEQRSRQRLRALVGVLLAATLIALALTAFAFSQRQEAQNNADLAATAQEAALNEADNAATAAAVAEHNAAEARSLAFASGAQLALANNNTDLGIVLALEANKVGTPSVQTQRTLANAAYAPGTRRIFSGHAGRVLGVAFSPEGSQALSASTDHSLILWDTATGEVIRRFEGHRDWVRSAAFSPDGRRAVSASADYTVIIWDVATGQALHVLEGHEGVVNSAVFSSDGTKILSGSADRTLILWDAASGQILRRFESYSDQVLSVAFSPSGFTALSGSRDGLVILWNIQSGQPILRFEGHTGRVNSVAFSPDERFAISGAEDHDIIIWSFEAGQMQARLSGHTAQIHSVAYSPDGTSIASAAEDNAIIIWNAMTGAIRRRFSGHTQLVSSVQFSPSGLQLLSGSWDATLRLWDIDSGAEIARLKGHRDDALTAVISPDGLTGLSASRDGSIIVWDIDNHSMLRRLEGDGTAINCVALSPDGESALSGSDDALLTLWDIRRGEAIRRFEGHSDSVSSVAFSPDGKLAVSGSRDNTLIVWDVASGEQIRRFIGHTFRVTSVAFSPSGQQVVSGSFDNTLMLWDLQTGLMLRQFEGHADWVRAVAFSPDGRFLLSGSADSTLILWDAATGARLRQFEGHNAQVYSVAFSPNGRLALSGAGDATLILWDIEGGAELSRFVGHDDAVYSAAFSPDGRLALSASGDDTVRLWQVSATLEELVAWTLANRYVRALTCVEREQYHIEPLCPAPTPIFRPNEAAI